MSNTDTLSPADRDLLAKAKWQMMREDCAQEWPAHVVEFITRLGEALADGEIMRDLLVRAYFTLNTLQPRTERDWLASVRKAVPTLAAQAPAAEG